MFILPKNLPWQKYIKLTIYDIYCLFADIMAFDPYMKGMLIPFAGGDLIADIEIREFALNKGRWDAILRCVYSNDPAMVYGIYFPATIDPDNALNRGISEGVQDTPYGDDSPTKPQMLRDIHNAELIALGLR